MDVMVQQSFCTSISILSYLLSLHLVSSLTLITILLQTEYLHELTMMPEFKQWEISLWLYLHSSFFESCRLPIAPHPHGHHYIDSVMYFPNLEIQNGIHVAVPSAYFYFLVFYLFTTLGTVLGYCLLAEMLLLLPANTSHASFPQNLTSWSFCHSEEVWTSSISRYSNAQDWLLALPWYWVSLWPHPFPGL